MNFIVDTLSSILKARIGNIEFNTDFRISILFEMLMQDNNVSKEDKVIQTFKLYYPRIEQITDFDKAIKDVNWFYRCGKEEPINNTLKENVKSNDKNKQIYSYEFDDGYIFSAFLQQYNIDLQEIKYLHWWKFRAMFECLSEDTKISEIMGYRAMDLSKIKDKEEKARYKKLKSLYALPDMRSTQEKEADFAQAFW